MNVTVGYHSLAPRPPGGTRSRMASATADCHSIAGWRSGNRCFFLGFFFKRCSFDPEFGSVVAGQASTRWNQTAHYHVFLQPDQAIDLAVYCGFCEYTSSLLK